MKTQRKLSNDEIAAFCSQVGMLLNAGILPTECMNILMQDAEDEETKEILLTILSSCRSGNSFTESLSASGVFPDYVLNMIRMGEESGNLDDVCQSLANYYEHEEMIANSIKNAVSYPFIMIGMMVLVIIVLLAKVLPIFNQVFIQLGSEMTGISASLLQLGTNINRYSTLLTVLLAILLVLYILGTKTVPGKKITARLLSLFPPAKRFYNSIAAGRFANGMALAFSSGMDTFASLDMVYELVANEELQEKITKCKKSIQKGDTFSDALTESGIFSKLYSRMVSVGFRTGSIDTVMRKISDNYEKETDRKIQSLISVLEPTLVIILSVVVGMILLSVILPLMGIMSSIG